MSAFQKINLYWRMARPPQLLAVALVYSWGFLHALSGLNEFPAVTYFVALSVLLLVSASIHYANEYADYDTDALTKRTPFSGGSGALQDYGAPREAALRAALVALIVGILIALLTYLSGLLPLVSLLLLLLGLAGGWMYSLRPLALAWRGWGELTNAFLGGMLLPVWGFSVQAAHIDGRIILLSLPFMLLVFNNLLATTWADRRADRQVGKFTLATRWPAGRLRKVYFLVGTITYLVLLVAGSRLLPNILVWITLLLLPLTLWAGNVYTRRHSPFPSVVVMVMFLVIQLGGCLVMLAGPQVLALFELGTG